VDCLHIRKESKISNSWSGGTCCNSKGFPCSVHYHPLLDKQGYCVGLFGHVWNGVLLEHDTMFGQLLFPSTSLLDKNQLKREN
jgi:hypothetical protein